LVFILGWARPLLPSQPFLRLLPFLRTPPEKQNQMQTLLPNERLPTIFYCTPTVKRGKRKKKERQHLQFTRSIQKEEHDKKKREKKKNNRLNDRGQARSVVNARASTHKAHRKETSPHTSTAQKQKKTKINTGDKSPHPFLSLSVRNPLTQQTLPCSLHRDSPHSHAARIRDSRAERKARQCKETVAKG